MVIRKFPRDILAMASTSFSSDVGAVIRIFGVLNLPSADCGNICLLVIVGIIPSLIPLACIICFLSILKCIIGHVHEAGK